MTDRQHENVNFLRLAKEMGANTVRTWGVDQGTPEYLNRAWEEGLFVDSGIWLNPVRDDASLNDRDNADYVKGSPYTMKAREEALSYVRMFKDHPAILFWNVGNEVLYWTKHEKQRIAFAQYLEELIHEIKTIDPNHPVIYSSAYTTAVPYIRNFVPSLGILGMNAYGGFSKAHREITATLDIPYVVTELGPTGNWDMPKDRNGLSYEPSDEIKALDYKKRAHEVSSFQGHCLGFFAFLLGDTSQVSETW